MDRARNLNYKDGMVDRRAEELDDAWQAARAAWPGVEVAADVFSTYVLERLAGEDAPIALDAVNTTDLYLACACSLGLPRALESLERTFLVHVPRMVAKMDTSGQLGEDVRQTLRERLLLARDGSLPRISTYHGRGTLLAWLRVATSRVAINLLNERKGRAEVTFDDADGFAVHVDGDLELELIKSSYREQFEAAVRDALGALPRRDRNLLRLHLVGGVSTHKLGAMFQVDQSTIVRNLAAARQSVRDATRARLSERLRMDVAEVDSLAGLMLSRLDLSLTGCLRSLTDAE